MALGVQMNDCTSTVFSTALHTTLVLQHLQASCCLFKLPSSLQVVKPSRSLIHICCLGQASCKHWPETYMWLQGQQTERPPSLLLSPGLLRRVATSRAAHEVDSRSTSRALAVRSRLSCLLCCISMLHTHLKRTGRSIRECDEHDFMFKPKI